MLFRSVWTSWTASATGIVTFSTQGSTFDTTLAAYTGDALGTLVSRAADADSGGYLTSVIRFNAKKGGVYHIAIDGYNGATGDVALSWALEETDSALPVITTHPLSLTGVVGGEEDGHDTSGVSAEKLYTTPEDMMTVYETLHPLGRFMFAATFGNVHGAYKPGAVKLKPTILRDGQKVVMDKHGTEAEMDLVFHGGSGSSLEDLRETLDYGVIKMNIDKIRRASCRERV